ncbi:MAG TPA: ABC transporter substrate-binding protein [Stellaceae bacterium]|nr:ABC transporter substrate-binding protein [Stellaceae bacterium]
MRSPHFPLLSIVAGSLCLAALAGSAAAQTKVTVGAVVGYTSLHLPTYVAMERGFFAKEGLDAKMVALAPNALKVAGLAGQVDFVPIPTPAALAALHGAQVEFLVGESLSSQWEIIADKDIAKAEDLKGKVVAYGEPGGAAYDEGARVLSQVFHMEPGKDYKVISFQGEPAEIAALIKGDVQAALLTTAEAVKAQKAGYKVLLSTSTYLPRLGGEIWTMKPFVDQHPDAVKAFDRAIAEAIMYIRNNKDGMRPIIKKYLGIEDPEEQGLLWDGIHDGYEATMPAKLFADIFEARRKEMVAMGQWPQDKPLPDPEQFIARKLLDDALKEAHYVPTKMATN